MNVSARWRIAAVVLIATLIAAGAGASTTVFGPAAYTVTAGPPQSYATPFGIDSHDTCGGRAAYFIVVSNDDGGVKSATIVLNGIVLLSERDFPLPAPQVIPFTPGASNALAVTLKGGKPGSVLRVAVERRIEETILGPVMVAVDRGAKASTFPFTIADASGKYLLVLRNGAGGAPWVSNASVTLNSNSFIGGVAEGVLARSMPVVSGANAITVTVAGQPGSALELFVEHELDESACGVRVAIESPADGTVVTTRRVVVTGTAAGPPDIGVVVNGVPVQLDLTTAGSLVNPYRWFVTLNLAPGDVTLVAKAATGSSTVSDTRTISFAPAEQAIFIEAAPAGGAVPLTVNFDFSLSVKGTVASYLFDLDGDGQYELSSTSRPVNLAQTFLTPGMRTVHARLMMADGRVYDSTSYVMPQTIATLNQIIRASWTRFTGAMMHGDTTGAIALLAGTEARQKYQQSLEALAGAGRLAAFGAAIQDIRPVSIHGNIAHYLMVKPEEGDTYGYHVYFVRDTDGVWRVLQF